MLDSLILSASALPVLGRTEDSLTEEASLFRLEGTVINGLGILHFTTTPGADGLWIRDSDADVIEAIGLAFEAENLVQVSF